MPKIMVLEVITNQQSRIENADKNWSNCYIMRTFPNLLSVTSW
jgi:hypothetical protein